MKRFDNRMERRRRSRTKQTQQFISAAYLGMVLIGVPTVELLTLSAAQAQTQAVPAEVRRGFTQLGQGLVNDAISTFRSAIERYPSSVEAKLGLAIAFRRAGRDPDAWQVYQQVLAQDPNNQLALKTVGILGGFRSEWQPKGIEALTRLLSQNPNDAEARAQRALLYGYQGRFAESVADYQIALRQNPTPEVLLGAAQVYTYSGNFAQGLELFNRYQATGKVVSGNAAIAYARALRGTGNPGQAVQVLQSQLPRQLNATAILIRSELSQAYLDNQQPTQALAVLDPLKGRSDARLPLARALNEIGQRQNNSALLSQAAGLYRQVLNQTSNPPVTLLREAADVLSGIPQERQFALQLYRQLAQQQPGDRALSLQQLALEGQAGTLSRAELRERLRGILQPLPTDPVQRVAIAQGLVRLDPDPEFLSVYQTLIQSGVDQPFLNFRLAQLLVERNDLEGAKAALATYRATPAGARDLAPQLLYAEIERREGNLAASAQRLEAIIATRSDADVRLGALRSLAGIRLAQGRPDDALVIYDQLLARDPQDLLVRLGRTSIAYQAKRISAGEAEAVLNTWLQSRPADTPAELYSLVGALPPSPEREPLYARLIEANPADVSVQVRYVQVLASRNPNQAQAQVNRLLARVRANSAENRDNVGLLFLQGQLAQALGNLTKADAAYQSILKVQPENTDALVALGGVRFQQRQFDSATDLYSQALSFKPDDMGAQRSLAELAAVQGRPLDAIQQLEQMQLQQNAEGGADTDLSRRVQQIQEDFLKQRGFQPPWERY